MEIEMTPETKALILSVAWPDRATPFAYDHEGTIDMVTLGANEIQALIDRVRATAIESYFAPKTAPTKSFAEVHPPAIGADCKCEHWQACNVCHPTYEAKHENN